MKFLAALLLSLTVCAVTSFAQVPYYVPAGHYNTGYRWYCASYYSGRWFPEGYYQQIGCHWYRLGHGLEPGVPVALQAVPATPFVPVTTAPVAPMAGQLTAEEVQLLRALIQQLRQQQTAPNPAPGR